MGILETTRSVCPECLGVIDAQIVRHNGHIVMAKDCDIHGHFEALVSSDAFAALEVLDRRVLRFSSGGSNCALNEKCQPCVKDQGSIGCKVRQLALLSIITILALAFVPLTAELASVSYNTTIFHSPFNYSHPVVYQVFETHYCPVYALIMLGAALVVTFVSNRMLGWAKILGAAGTGALGFSFLRLMVFHFYSSNLIWFEFWEEATELMFIGGLAIVLWMFRERLEKPGTETEHADKR